MNPHSLTHPPYTSFLKIALVCLTTVISLSSCENQDKQHRTVQAGIEMNLMAAAWPTQVAPGLQYPAANLVSQAALQNEKGTVIVQESKDASAAVKEWYKASFKKLNFQVLLNTNRPSPGKAMMIENPELIAKAGLDAKDKDLPGENFLLIGEGKFPGEPKFQSTVTVSILSGLKKTQVRMLVRKIPLGVSIFDMEN